MKDLSKLTKTELIEEVENGKHLATAVEAKDLEIENLNKNISSLVEVNKNLKKEVENSKHLASAVEAKDNEINSLRIKTDTIKEETEAKGRKELDKYRKDEDYAVTELKKEYDLKIENLNKDFSEKEKYLLEVVNERTNLIETIAKQRNEFSIQFGNLLKVLQGATDTYMFVNDTLVKTMGETFKK